RALGVGASFLVAMLCKESAVGFLAALPLVHLAVNWRRPGPPEFGALARALAPHYRAYIALLCALALYFVARFAVSGALFGLEGMVTPARYIDSFGQHVLVVIASLAHHVWSVLWPFQDIVPGRYLPLPINGMELLPMAAAGTAVIVVALAAVCTNSSGRVPALLFLAFVAALLPVANIVPIPTVVIPSEVAAGSRYLAFPLIFACLAVPFVIRLAEASLVHHGRYVRALLWLIVGAWILGSVANVRVIIPLWSNDVVLSSWAIRQGGASFWRHAHIGAYYLLTGDYSRSREASAAALKLRDDELTSWVWNNLGVAEANLGHTAEARRAFRRAFDLGTDDIKSRINLASLERTEGKPQIAVDELEEGLRRIRDSGRRHKREAQLRYHLGLAYGALGRSEEAISQLNAALALHRDPERRRIVEEALRSIASK
ncbi:MAG: tetratricopeptide repeat protein, partial [Betaproteobacteria bacterium]|nr:tetratricopeptide repeat protein [Betaproteobacteria bacterium]